MFLNILKFIQSFLNSNIGVVTFLVGFFVIYLYLKQKKDRKREAASLILQEIRYAEQLIRNYYKYKNYQLSDRLLPTNSWNDNIHLFLKNLEDTEIDLISCFYSNAAYIDILITKISDYKNLPLKPVVTTSSFPIQSSSFTINNQNTPVPSPQIMLPQDPVAPTQDILKSVSMNIGFIYNTPAGEKLKKISKKKWYYLL